MLDEAGLPLPVIAKPACEGSSKGIRNRCLIDARPRSSARRSSSCGSDYRQPVLVEEFIAGDEVTVGIVGNDPPRVARRHAGDPEEADRRSSCTAWR